MFPFSNQLGKPANAIFSQKIAFAGVALHTVVFLKQPKNAVSKNTQVYHVPGLPRPRDLCNRNFFTKYCICGLFKALANVV